MQRDFEGYRGKPPDPKWPGGARLAVSFVVNVEEGAELFVGDGDERNESIHEISEVVQGVPDFCMASHFEYGTRAGYWRIAELLDRYGVKATFSSSGRAVERNPWIARDALARGHEISAHGWRWEGQAEMEEAAEREMIARTARAIEEACGPPPPAGTPSRRRPSTRAGSSSSTAGSPTTPTPTTTTFPYAVEVAGRSARGAPLRLRHQRHALPGGARLRPRGGLRTLLHGRLRVAVAGRGAVAEDDVGRPPPSHHRAAGRIAGLDRLLAAATSREGVWFARRDEIARHWRDRMGLPAPAG